MLWIVCRLSHGALFLLLARHLGAPLDHTIRQSNDRALNGANGLCILRGSERFKPLVLSTMQVRGELLSSVEEFIFDDAVSVV